ncbi:MAG: RNA methyltransferase [Bacteroidia bacterium]|nr:RNA methyltransferase [Bacteroidia bacterium]MDW8302022.1 RNA methyltransferase [Bacteroidia bacterium]
MKPISQAQVQKLKKLHLSKYRYSEKAFLVEGDKIVQEIVSAEYPYLKAIYVLQSYIPKYTLPDNIPIYTLTELQAKKLTQLQNFSKIMALVGMPEPPVFNPNQNAVFLESIRDPGNLGTILRICDWYNIPQLLLTPDCTDIYNAKVLQASMGSFMRVACITLNELPSHYGQVYTADLAGLPIETVQFKQPFILHIGNESRGASRIFSRSLRITIPRIGKAESLNAAVATAICLDRIRTQQQ